jgi:hypothetical protein
MGKPLYKNVHLGDTFPAFFVNWRPEFLPEFEGEVLKGVTAKVHAFQMVSTLVLKYILKNYGCVWGWRYILCGKILDALT